MAAGKKRRKTTMADTADVHDLYQRSVQCVEAEIDFVDDTFKAIRKRRARTLREDFCGTANTSCEWVRRRRGNEAIGVDLDAAVLAWGAQHNVAALGKAAARRITLQNADVTRVRTRPVDVVLAMNFSYWIFQARDALRGYFRHVRRTLAPDGVFFLDAYGGHDAFKVMRERTAIDDDFTYIWDQASYNPIDGHMRCHIHFRFADGSRLNEAFTYDWRLWTLPEIREVLAEAGFNNVTVYWQGTDDDGEADGEFTAAEQGDPDPAWIAYVTAEP